MSDALEDLCYALEVACVETANVIQALTDGSVQEVYAVLGSVAVSDRITDGTTLQAISSIGRQLLNEPRI